MLDLFFSSEDRAYAAKTDETSEDKLVARFAAAFSHMMKSHLDADYPDDFAHTLRGYLPLLVDLVCSIRGYKSPVTRQSILIAGGRVITPEEHIHVPDKGDVMVRNEAEDVTSAEFFADERTIVGSAALGDWLHDVIKAGVGRPVWFAFFSEPSDGITKIVTAVIFAGDGRFEIGRCDVRDEEWMSKLHDLCTAETTKANVQLEIHHGAMQAQYAPTRRATHWIIDAYQLEELAQDLITGKYQRISKYRETRTIGGTAEIVIGLKSGDDKYSLGYFPEDDHLWESRVQIVATELLEKVTQQRGALTGVDECDAEEGPAL